MSKRSTSGTIRSVEEWREIINAKLGDDTGIARRILGDITGYRHGLACEDGDMEQLANALRAFAEEVS